MEAGLRLVIVPQQRIRKRMGNEKAALPKTKAQESSPQPSRNQASISENPFLNTIGLILEPIPPFSFVRQLQKRIGNQATNQQLRPLEQCLLDDPSPTPSNDSAQTPKPVDPEVQLEQALIDFWRQKPQIATSLGLSKKQQGHLQWNIQSPSSYKGQDGIIKDQFLSKKKKERLQIAKKVSHALQSDMARRLTPHMDQLVVAIKAAAEPTLQTYAATIATREEKIERGASIPNKERRVHLPFYAVFKYLWLRVIRRQITSPDKDGYSMDKAYREALGLKEKDDVLPGLVNPTLVAALNQVPKAARPRLADKVLPEIMRSLTPYMARRMGTTPDRLEQEYANLGKTLKHQLEGGIEGYFAMRTGLINKYGDPSDAAATLQVANRYYDKLLVEAKEAGFLYDPKGKKVAGWGNLVHPEIRDALQKGQTYLKSQEGWLEDVLKTTRKYGSTRVRENRNAPQHLSQHS